MITGWRKHLRRWHPEGIPWPGAVFYNVISRSRVFTQHYQLVADDLADYCHNGRVLDIGTGPGRLLLALRRTLPGAKATGVDISAAMVSVARKNLLPADGAGLCEVMRAGADALPFLNDSFDAVVSTGSLHHWKDPAAGLNEVHRVLKPGGHALMYDLVSKLPSEIRRKAQAEFGALRTTLLWLHSLEEPFYSPEDMVALASTTRFGNGEARFVGVMCCLAMRKRSANPGR